MAIRPPDAHGWGDGEEFPVCGVCIGSAVVCNKDNEWEECYRCGGTGLNQSADLRTLLRDLWRDDNE